MSYLLLLGALVFQYWFWFDRIPDLDHRNCQQYGFVLSQVRLNSKVSVVLNALMYFWLGIVCLYLFVMKLRAATGAPDLTRRPKKAHIELLQNLDIWIRIVVALLATLAIELTVAWNEIPGVNILSTVGQTIPLVIGLGGFVRVLYVSMFYEQVARSPSRSTSISSRRPSEVDIEISRPPRARKR